VLSAREIVCRERVESMGEHNREDDDVRGKQKIDSRDCGGVGGVVDRGNARSLSTFCLVSTPSTFCLNTFYVLYSDKALLALLLFSSSDNTGAMHGRSLSTFCPVSQHLPSVLSQHLLLL
jgi:hypothetical protein